MSSFQANQDLAIELGSLIVVTGVSGMLAIHVADEALKAGFRVRGTVRSQEKGNATAALLRSTQFEYVIVEDLADDGAFDDAMSGAAAVIHCAASTSLSGAVEEMIPPAVKGTMNVLSAARASHSVKRVVLTSTSGAASGPRPGVNFRIDRDTWNTRALDIVKNTSLQDQAAMGFEWGYQVYVASKVESERAAWAYMEKEKPPFVLNVINPAMNWGKLMGSKGVSGAQLSSLLNGKIPNIPSVYMVDTIDDARIHVAAAIDSTVTNERIFACDSPFNWKMVIQIIHEIAPSIQLPLPDPNELLDISDVDNILGAILLKKWWGQPGYKGLEQTIKETLEMYQGEVCGS